jgi:hypothetical protein
MGGPTSWKTKLTPVAIVYHEKLRNAAQYFLQRAIGNGACAVKAEFEIAVCLLMDVETVS